MEASYITEHCPFIHIRTDKYMQTLFIIITDQFLMSRYHIPCNTSTNIQKV